MATHSELPLALRLEAMRIFQGWADPTAALPSRGPFYLVPHEDTASQIVMRTALAMLKRSHGTSFLASPSPSAGPTGEAAADGLALERTITPPPVVSLPPSPPPFSTSPTSASEEPVDPLAPERLRTCASVLRHFLLHALLAMASDGAGRRSPIGLQEGEFLGAILASAKRFIHFGAYSDELIRCMLCALDFGLFAPRLMCEGRMGKRRWLAY
jgi:hypothetical protein